TGLFRGRYRGDKAVASPWNVRHITFARVAVAERPAQSGDMDPETALFDESAGPNAGGQLVFADEFTGMLDEHRQNIERAASKAHGLLVFQQNLSPWKQPEAPERE